MAAGGGGGGSGASSYARWVQWRGMDEWGQPFSSALYDPPFSLSSPAQSQADNRERHGCVQ